MQRTASYTKGDHKGNEDILDKLKIKSAIDYVQNFQSKCEEEVNRMNTGKIPKQILHYQPREQSSVRCPMKRKKI
jgi:hypothetical protein